MQGFVKGGGRISYTLATQLHCWRAKCRVPFSGGGGEWYRHAIALLLGQMQVFIQWGRDGIATQLPSCCANRRLQCFFLVGGGGGLHTVSSSLPYCYNAKCLGVRRPSRLTVSFAHVVTFLERASLFSWSDVPTQVMFSPPSPPTPQQLMLCVLLPENLRTCFEPSV